MIAASRRSVDDHIVTLGLPSENHEAISFELSNDTWLPRIELQGDLILHCLSIFMFCPVKVRPIIFLSNGMIYIF